MEVVLKTKREEDEVEIVVRFCKAVPLKQHCKLIFASVPIAESTNGNDLELERMH